jgi:predicted AlkP superfamily phosphohydrolase/phosphomutase
MKKRKVLVIGLDGGTLEAIGPLIEKGELPNLGFMMKHGVGGELRSTIPPVSGPAWATFITGKNPGKHGVYSFVQRAPGDYRSYVIHANSIRSKTLWSILSDHGLKVGVFNVPLTYPPEKVNGFMVSGFLTPDFKTEFTYPPSLSSELKEVFGDYDLDVSWVSGATRNRYSLSSLGDGFLKDLRSSTQKTAEIAEFLMKGHEWDFFMVVFTGPDRLQHAMWNYIRPQNPEIGKTRDAQRAVMSYYMEIDQLVGKICQAAGDHATIFTISDHGFGELEKKFYINEWLREKGLLYLNRSNTRFMIYRFLKKIDSLGLRKKLAGQMRSRIGAGSFKVADSIDWSRTRAYSFSNSEQGIYINLAGREPFGIVQEGEEYERLRDEIIDYLRALVDPDTKERILTEVYRREEVYSGPYLHEAPDIVFSLKNYSYIATISFPGTVYSRVYPRDGTGTHRMNGIFLAYGENLKAGSKIHGAQIPDVTCTLLYLLGLDIPRDMDGRVLLEALSDSFIESNPVNIVDPLVDYPSTRQDIDLLTRQETEKVEAKLRGLGYID